MTRSKKNKVYVSEEFQISVHLALKNFEKNEEQKELEFPSSFTSQQRAYIHKCCVKLGFKSKSRGKSAGRYLTVYKKEGSTIVQEDAIFNLGRTSQHNILSLLQKFPITSRERQILMPLTERDKLLIQDTTDIGFASARLSSGVPRVPDCKMEPDSLPFRQSLPIWGWREDIIQSVIRHQVVLISGETGCGKTTQVPQYIIDHSAATGQPCRIICTQPRRIAAISVAERVALERGEKIGQTVGYQIRLESRISPKTLLTFCTNGILLRTLMGGDSCAATLTHVIVDELHERDKFSDFLLIILRDLLLKFRGLKLILMSAVLDMQLFVKYFGGCPVVEVPGRVFDVQPYFLEDILKNTGYITQSMKQYMNNLEKQGVQRQALENWCSSLGSDSTSHSTPSAQSNSQTQFLESDSNSSHQGAIEKLDVDHAVASKMNCAIYDAWQNGDDDSFCFLLQLLLSENISVDYQHSEASVTSLMVAAARGNVDVVEQLLSLGASTYVKSSNDWNALDFAQHFGQKLVEEILKAHISSNMISCNEENNKGAEGESKISDELQILLDAYQQTTDAEKVDLNLIICVLKHLFASQTEGSILVFLPGYDDIISLRDRILSDKDFSDHRHFVIFTLHSQMQTSDQKSVFKPVPCGIKKIILSTNIAETSITVNDVVFVIDSGKVKEKSYDALMGTTQLRAGWVSQSSAIQRRGRAGRCMPGVCYHLFSHTRFQSLQKFQVPEILRVPIHELCLQAKLLAPVNVPIADFLARAPDPPPYMVTRNAITLLKTIDALDNWEDLTELGLYMLDLPVEPRLAKMVLYSVVLKCLDPVLTIACTLAYRDPFVLPSQPSQKLAAALAKRKLSGNTYSDHVALLRAMQLWQAAKADGYEKSFCNKNFLSSSTLEMIYGMRMQLIAQLRASGFVRARGSNCDLRDLNSNSDVWPVIKAALCAGSYPNIITIDRERRQLLTQKESKVRFHTSSVLNATSAKKTAAKLHAETLANLPSDWLIYEEMSRTGRISHAHCCTLVSPITIALFCGPSRLPPDCLHEPDHGQQNPDNSDSEEDASDNQNVTFKLDDWITFRVEPKIGRLALQIRQKWHSLFLRRMHMPNKPWLQADETVIQTIVKVLVAEEQALGLQKTAGISPRPQLPSMNNYFPNNYPQQNPSYQRGSDSNYLPTQEMHLNALSISEPNRQFYNAAPSASYNNAMRRMHFDSQRAQYHTPSDTSDMSSVHSFGAECQGINMSPNASPAALSTASSHPRPLAVNQRYPATRSAKIKYFIIKAQHFKLLELSFATSTWPFSPTTEKKLIGAVKEENDVILIFSLQTSGDFQGIARFTTHIADQRFAEPFSSMGGNCYYIEWLRKGRAPFQNARHMQSVVWNDFRRFQMSLDGQELEPLVGESLCRMWEKGPEQKTLLQRHTSSRPEASNMRNQCYDTRLRQAPNMLHFNS